MAQLQSISIIGGGRWSRVLLDVLTGVAPKDLEILAYSSSNAAGMKQWAAEKGLAARIKVVDRIPETPAVIVANKAGDHEKAATEALKRGAFVLLEKPLAPNAEAAERILAAANGKLAASQVFRWARYVDGLAKACRAAGGLESLDVKWTDVVGATRHGEVVRHDTSISFVADALPHVCAIVDAVAGRAPDVLKQHKKDGETHDLLLDAGGIPVRARLTRGGPARERVVTATAGGKTIVLNFAPEPGILTIAGKPETADPGWETGPRPLALMLSAFLEWAGGGTKDPRLEPETALKACRLADAAR